MDRNGKKPKAARPADSLNAERSDTKAGVRDASGRTDAPRVQGGTDSGNATGAPSKSGRKGHRG